MYNKTPEGKNPKGTVSVLVSNGRLQLRFRFAGDRQYISLGLPDTPTNRKAAEQKKAQIELDIASGNFDPTLAKYKPKRSQQSPREVITPALTPTAAVLWQKYREYKASSLKESTRLHHEALARILDKTPAIPITDALVVKSELEKVTTVYQAKRILTQLGATCKWAKKHGLIDENPYDGMVGEMPKYRYQLEPKPNAFTEEQREQVIEAFRQHQGNWNKRGYTGFAYAHYAPIVEFWFLTGCRPSEAIGLRWKQVSEDCQFINFAGAITYCYGKKIKTDSSKNNKHRTFPCSNRLEVLLRSLKTDESNPEALVFPSPKGKAINYNNFCNNAWNKLVDPIKPDTTPYSCRDTFITTQILKGVPIPVIAKWCDTSVEMIQKHYADFLKMLSIRPID
ncbi:MAG: DUF3596 domain-containing protein [Leptolyngbyaceae cyanobacterium bins.349]|nr:DUF3596 domain-containing protein [Leptolyngbyaceae cyanobacterium bins.349]